MDSWAHSWPCRPVPARFQLTTTYWHKSQSFEHVLTIDLDRSVPISSTIRGACSLCTIVIMCPHVKLMYAKDLQQLATYCEILYVARCSKISMIQFWYPLIYKYWMGILCPLYVAFWKLLLFHFIQQRASDNCNKWLI